ncbi:MAG: SDR family NAD(P)-dependent oxidoreductase [Polyangiaceae bacterium]|nr:SDR family NAD(P)-dependent oxidoreductase [Myxococcales bacterium]MCB9587205.1 SDR family NAD(P)-dependent oxidoreductase [Polyangiaceae bacterium]MCB9609412.1 SDR family NAD(P)-dependent oxidoreductase [Polyangiaceae bacterium]
MSDSQDAQRWTGKVALVTGASSGIGRATARALHALGMRVAVTGRREERLQALRGELGDSLLPLPCDLRDLESIKSVFARIQESWGGIDVLVNNAGIGHETPLIGGDAEHWREMLEVNVLALCECTSLAVSDMQRRGVEGHIIHISSMSAHRVPSGSGVYSATKYAVRSLTEGLRQELRELGSPIRVSSVSPGFVETEFHSRYFQSEERAQATYRRYKVLQPEDIAKSVIHLLTAPPHVQIHDVLVRATEQPT